MTLLSDLPWLWCGADPTARPVDASCQIVPPNPMALADAARALSIPMCVLVLPHIRPLPGTGTLSPDSALLASERPVLYPAENALTGDYAPAQGVWVLTPAQIAAQADALVSGEGAGALAPLVPPTIAAVWECGASPEAAFRAGHAAMQGPHSAALALTASLGADRPTGVWWGIGAARALLGDPAGAAWAGESALPMDAESVEARRVELARMVRVRCGLPVHPLDAEAAAALRRMRAPLAPPEVWDRHAADLQALMPGANDAPTIQGYRLARAALWGPG